VTIDRRHPMKVSWTGVSGMVYDIASSSLSSLASSGTAAATCLVSDHESANYVDNRPDPPQGDGYYYLIRAQSACGVGTYGWQSAGLERMPTAVCP
jgi:hypothetical protein